MARRSSQLATPAAIAALAVLISLESMAIGVPAAATLSSRPTAILAPELDRRTVATLISRLSEGVRCDDLLVGLRHGGQIVCHPHTLARSVDHGALLPTSPDRPAANLAPLAIHHIDLPPPAADLA